MWVSLAQNPKSNRSLANVSFFCFDSIFEMDSPQNWWEIYRWGWGVEMGMREHRWGKQILFRKERVLQFYYRGVRRQTWKDKLGVTLRGQRCLEGQYVPWWSLDFGAWLFGSESWFYHTFSLWNPEQATNSLCLSFFIYQTGLIRISLPDSSPVD